jgi:hypothetical protein
LRQIAAPDLKGKSAERRAHRFPKEINLLKGGFAQFHPTGRRYAEATVRKNLGSNMLKGYLRLHQKFQERGTPGQRTSEKQEGKSENTGFQAIKLFAE